MAPLPPDQIASFFETPLPLEELYSEAMEIWDSSPAADRVDRLLNFFTILYLQNNILTKVDRASMMCSLETRAIFLDNDLVDFCCNLPSHFKLRNGKRKFLLKKAMEPLLPHEIIYRKKKGFGIPLADWLKNTPEVSTAIGIAGIDNSFARKQWHDHKNGKSDNRFFIWTWLSLQYAAHRSAS